jgi:hypothetical protein
MWKKVVCQLAMSNDSLFFITRLWLAEILQFTNEYLFGWTSRELSVSDTGMFAQDISWLVFSAMSLYVCVG